MQSVSDIQDNVDMSKLGGPEREIIRYLLEMI